MNTETLKILVKPEEIQEYTISEGTPIWKYWEQFVNEYYKEGRSMVTIQNARDKLKFVIKELKISTIESLNKPVQLREKLLETGEERHWSGSTINSYVKDINTYFIWLEDTELISENRLRKFRKCKEKPQEQYTMQQEQVEKLQAHIMTRKQTHQVERWRNKLFIEFLILTGARPCELAEIQCKDIEIKDSKYILTIRGRKQKGKIRRYKLPSHIRDTYEMYMLQRQRIKRQETGLFISLSRSTGWTYKGMTALMKRLSKELGFRVTPYSIRRFVATKMYKAETPLRDMMAYLGHTRSSTTLRYVENGSEMTQKGVDVMGGMF